MSPQHCTPCPPCQSCTKVKTSSLSSSSCFDVFSTSWIWRPEKDFPRYMDWIEQYHCLPSLIRLVPWPIRLIFRYRHHEDYFFSRNRSFYFVSSSSLINVLRSFHVRLLFGGVTAVIRPESTRDHHPIRDLDVIYVISICAERVIFSEGKWRWGSGAGIHRICRRTSEPKEYLIHTYTIHWCPYLDDTWWKIRSADSP